MDKDQFICESIVRALKSGLVPARGIGRIAVGRDDETKQIQRDLEFAKQGGAWVKIFSGDYGVGKTFLCSLVREEAWKAGFIVSAVDLGRELGNSTFMSLSKTPVTQRSPGSRETTSNPFFHRYRPNDL